MGYKTILVHCDASKVVQHRLEIAAALAQRFDAHLVGFHARRPFEMPVFFDGGIGFPMDDFFKSHEEGVKKDEIAASAAFAKAIKGRHLSTEWRTATGNVDSELPIQARYADLVIVGQAELEPTATPSDLPEVTALGTGRPILVVPYIGAKTPGKTVLVCWNASREAARAVVDALPFLKAAETVIVLAVNPLVSATGHGAEPGADVAAWLSRHGVKVTVQRDAVASNDDEIGGVILSRAADHGADLIVMGIYGHSRMREMVLGGASRSLLGSMTVPVLMAH
jgi:nucleotide-binding universal stress UspA family protein